jgi:hypothetical protein
VLSVGAYTTMVQPPWHKDFLDLIVNCTSVAHGKTSKERPTVALNDRHT